LWVQFAALLPARYVHHPLGCHRRRIPDRLVFDKLIQVLVFGCGYRRIADRTCSATTLRRRRDEWVALGLAERLRLEVLAGSGQPPQATGCWPPPWTPSGGSGCCPPGRVVHLDAGYDYQPCRQVLAGRGMVGQIAARGIPGPIQAGRRWVIERAHAWGNQYGKLRWCTERRRLVVAFWLALANAAIVCGRLVRRAWTATAGRVAHAAAHDHLPAQARMWLRGRALNALLGEWAPYGRCARDRSGARLSRPTREREPGQRSRTPGLRLAIKRDDFSIPDASRTASTAAAKQPHLLRRRSSVNMGKIVVHEFITLDGVIGAPTWTFDYPFDPKMAAAIGTIMGSSTALLLGRRTYEEFAPAWSSRTAEEDPGAPFMNESPKYVVSATLRRAEWNNSTILGGYSAPTIGSLKDRIDGNIYVSGSGTLVRALLADQLVDELHLFVFPLAVGAGARLFADGGPPAKFTLAGTEAYDSGVVHLTYRSTK
jgi:dihydrofolate reductase/transposase